MALKTDYKDDVFDGNRKYTQVTNDDGTVSFVDATAYTTEGDVFGADDINAITKAVNSVAKSVTLSASSWNNNTYTISDDLITADSNQDVFLAANVTKAQAKAFYKAMVIGSGQAAGSITLTALNGAPSVDIPIKIIFRGEK